MTTEYITLKVGERIQEGDLVYVPSRQRYETVENTSFCMTVAPGSVYRRPVTGPAANSHFDRHELAEEERGSEEPKEDGLTLEEELENELAEANGQVGRLLEENDRLKSLVDELRRSLQTSEERRLRLMHTDIVTAAVTETETELERKAWELYCRLDVDEEGSFRQAERFIAERDRRRKESGK